MPRTLLCLTALCLSALFVASCAGADLPGQSENVLTDEERMRCSQHPEAHREAATSLGISFVGDYIRASEVHGSQTSPILSHHFSLFLLAMMRPCRCDFNLKATKISTELAKPLLSSLNNALLATSDVSMITRKASSCLLLALAVFGLGMWAGRRPSGDTDSDREQGTPIELEDPPWKQRFERPWS